MFADEMRSTHPEQVEVVMGGEPRAEALLFDGDQERTLALCVSLSANTHAYLADHAIDGNVVLPVALVVEWFSRLSRAFRPDLSLASIAKLKVLSGVKLSAFEVGGDQLRLNCRQIHNGVDTTLALELSSPTGTVHYRATAKMVEGAVTTKSSAPAQLNLTPWNDATIYGDVLFHQNSFQVIETLDGVSPDGISGTLKGVDSAAWTFDNWQTDVAAMDGGFQLVLLWAREMMGGAVLPMGFGELSLDRDTPPSGPIRCVATCRAASKSRGIADLNFHDQKGARFASLTGVEVIRRPDVANS